MKNYSLRSGYRTKGDDKKADEIKKKQEKNTQNESDEKEKETNTFNFLLDSI